MHEKVAAWSRTTVLSSIVASATVLWIVGTVAVPTTSAQQPSRFMGGNPSVLELNGIATQRLKFPGGSRSNWHSHAQGQLLMVESGKARTQERGKPVREMLPGQPWWTETGVEHWHGAGLDQDLVQLTIYAGDVKWLEPVQDKEYKAPLGK